MTFTIDVQNEASYPLDPLRLQAAAAEVLRQHDVQADSGLSVVLVDDAEVQRLNNQFRGIDAPTDILSFRADDLPAEVDDEPPYLGDLIVAYPYASAQAARLGHDLHDSLALLVVHGTLHLLGYDHDTFENKTDMWAAQEAALLALNIPIAIIPALEGEDHDDPA